MAKKWIGIANVACLGAVLALGGCSSDTGNGGNGGTNGNTGANANGAANEPAGGGSSGGGKKVTITLLNAQDNGIRDKLLPDVVKKKFEAANPDITLEIVSVPYDQFDSKMNTMVAGGTPPDIWSHWGQSGFVDYNVRDMVLDLTPYMADFNNPNIPQSTLDIYKIDGQQKGIPLNIYSSMIFYNKELFDKAGVTVPNYKPGDSAWTWDKLVELAKSVSKDYGKPSAVYGFTYGMGEHLLTYSWDWGLDVFAPAYASGFLDKADLTDPKLAEATKFFQDMIFKDKVMPTKAVEESIGKIGDPLLTGKVAMSLVGSWAMGGFKETNMKFGVLPLPTGPAGTSTPFIYADPLMISSKSKNPDAAWKLVKFMTSPEMQMEMTKTTGYPPSDTVAYAEWFKQYEGLTDTAYLEEVNSAAIEKGKESPNHLIAGYGDITSFMLNEQQAIFNKEQDPAAVLKDMNPKFQQLLDDIKQKAGK
ncbi:multiple sugar transport system substrate-binding protein [Paenibacillus sp. UNC496MF]|uniref:ABC transporter substrate-binding protein n=1 Tax=Paenibacillus sp. UNC496MF TaxID=1502753 RepID=UPI0008DF36A2|nr:sugar ABC transporter substrate-binding protein [Paenibacillus sp. UNC496MF]SFI39902.1 multiple sugar transport system substrate-binding protein [Paenibacillus sp. UNC496MF]